jgi:hypothetical protein
MLNAFCRVAPSDLFNFLAILPAGVFLRAIVLSSRTSLEVHARRFFDFFAIKPPFHVRQLVSLMGAKEKTTDGIEMIALKTSTQLGPQISPQIRQGKLINGFLLVSS